MGERVFTRLAQPRHDEPAPDSKALSSVLSDKAFFVDMELPLASLLVSREGAELLFSSGIANDLTHFGSNFYNLSLSEIKPAADGRVFLGAFFGVKLARPVSGSQATLEEMEIMSMDSTVPQAALFRLLKLPVAFSLILAAASNLNAQYIGLGLPFQNATESYYQRTGVGFSFWLPGSTTGKGVVGLMPNGQFTPDGRIHFSQGGMRSALPPFGGYDPGADARLGFAYNGSGGGFRLNFALGQGNSRTLSHTTPSLVVPNGVPGWIYSGQLRPFVTGIYPVVGGMPAGGYIGPLQPTSWVNPVDYKLWQLQQQAAEGSVSEGARISEGSQDRLVLGGGEDDLGSGGAVPSASNSSAARPALSVDELKRRRAKQIRDQERERKDKIEALVASAEQAAAERYYGAARERLRRAIRMAKPQEREALQVKLDELSGKR